MPTKYTRSDSVHEARETRQTPYRRQPTFCGGNPKRRLMVIYIGLIGSALLLFSYDQFIARPSKEKAQPQRGIAVVVEKVQLETEPPAHALRVQLEDSPDSALQEVPFPEDYWKIIEVADRLTVIYTESAENGEITVHECGLVALSDGIR